MSTITASRKRTMKWVGAALTVPLILGLAACGGGSGSSGSSSGAAATSLNVQDYYTDDESKGVYEAVLTECGKAAGVTMNFTHTPGAGLIQKVLQQASSKTMSDLQMLDNPDLQQIAASGALTPLADLGVNADGFAQGVVDASTYQGKLYGLQPITNTIALFYNPDALAKAGLQPPTTWDELKSTAKALTSGQTYGLAFSAPANYEGTWQFLPFMWSNGGDEKNIATPETAAALQLWVDLVNDGSASKSVVNWTQADVNDQFKAGNAAMMVNGPWQIAGLKAAGTKYGVVNIPVPQAGDKLQAPLGGETWTVPQTGDPAKQAKAAEVLKCLNSDQNQLKIATERNVIPTKTTVAATFASQQPEMKAFVDTVSTARSRTAELGADFPAAATKIYTAIQSALTGGQSPTDALESAQNG